MSLTFSQSAASGLVPLLARLVLAAVLVPAGYHKMTTHAEFSGDDARRLRELQLVDAADASLRPAARAAALQTPPPAAAHETSQQTAPTQPAATSSEPTKARSLHSVTLLVDRQGWQYPAAQAWALALLELVGGVLLLVGLFARLWAMGVAIAMGVAFYLTSMEAYAATSGFFSAFPIADFNRFAAQAALCALALGIVLSGAGAVSFDRLIMGSGGSGKKAGKQPKASADG